MKFTKVEVGFHKNTRYFNVPSVILTVSGCNLKCLLGDKWCEKSFSEQNKISVNEAKKFVNANKNIRHIVITGGEPLLYKEDLEHFLNDIWRDDMVITIYTNGTLPILNPLSNKYRIALYVVNLYKKKIPEAGTKIINPYTKKEFVYGTNDIEHMQQINIQALRNLCVYTNDYLLCFDGEPDQLEEYSNSIVQQICDTGDEFLDNFLKTHSPYLHIAYRPKEKKDIQAVQKVCLQNGRFFIY